MSYVIYYSGIIIYLWYQIVLLIHQKVGKIINRMTSITIKNKVILYTTFSSEQGCFLFWHNRLSCVFFSNLNSHHLRIDWLIWISIVRISVFRSSIKVYFIGFIRSFDFPLFFDFFIYIIFLLLLFITSLLQTSSVFHFLLSEDAKGSWTIQEDISCDFCYLL